MVRALAPLPWVIKIHENSHGWSLIITKNRNAIFLHSSSLGPL